MSRQEKLPTDWDRVKLRKLVAIDKESLGAKTPPDYEFLYASLSDVNSGVINRDLPLIKFSDAPSRARRKVKKGDVLFSTVRPNLEGYARINGQVNNLIASTGFAVLSPKKITDTDFIYQYLYSYDIKRQIYALVVGSNYPAVNSSDVANLKFSIPKSTSERQAIADLLSTWDEAIEKTERLIQAKEKRFKWLLRELISDPQNTQVNTEWKKIKLGDVCKVTTGQSAPQDISVFTSFGFPFIRVSSLDFLLGKSDSEQTEHISMEKGNELKMTLFQPGTVLFAKSGMSALQPRICKLKQPSFVVSHLCALIPKKSIHEDYLMYYLMKFHPNRLIQGDGFPSIKTSEVCSLKILLPPLNEQQEIAETLSSAQHEIDLLKKLADKYKTQKRGLMQKMLTGEWRVRGFATNDEG